MRLLDTHTGHFVEKFPESTVYAILSHTWDAEGGEQKYEELRNIQRRYPYPENGRSGGPEVSTSSSPEQVRPTSSSTPHPSQLPKNSLETTPDQPEAPGHLAQSALESVLDTSSAAHHAASHPESRSRIPEGYSSSFSQQGPPQPSLMVPVSEQPMFDCPPETAPCVPHPTRPKPKSRFTRGMARLKTWFQYRSAPNAPRIWSSSPSATLSPLAAPRRRFPVQAHRDDPYPPPPPPQLQSDSHSATTAPPVARGHITTCSLLFPTLASTVSGRSGSSY